MKFKRILSTVLIGAMLVPNAVYAADDNITVYIAGDSTACEYGEDEKYALPRGGWGMYLGEFLVGAEVKDMAKSGRSSKSLVAEDEYKQIFDNIKEGDYLLIQFGHNDAKNTKPEDIELRYTSPEGDKDTEGSFKNSLYVNYIKPAQEKGAKPVLITPISRRKFGEDGKVTDSHGLYDDAVRELAKELDIPCIDMTEKTTELYNKYGEEGAKSFHAIFKDSEKGFDNTHLNRFGAEYIASVTADEIAQEYPDGLGAYVDEESISNVSADVSRGEFTAKLVRLLGIELQSNSNFADVKADNENYTAIATAKAAGIVKGNEKGEFMPNGPLTIQDMAVITARALEYVKAIEVKESNSASACFEGVSEYAYSAVGTLYDADFWLYAKEIDSLINAKANINEFETSAVLAKAYELKSSAEKVAPNGEMSLDELEKVE